jgi:hypothetical protein
MANTTTTPADSKNDSNSVSRKKHDRVQTFKRRMLAWANPVEFVNNMYGCHPDENGNEYFQEVFRK